MKLFKIVFFSVFALAVSSCASVTQGPYEALILDSKPSKAEVALSNGRVCTTPCSIEMWRKHGVIASMRRPGYHTVNVSISADMDLKGGTALIAGNGLVCCSLVGVVVDLTNGAHQHFTPNPVVIDLVPLWEGEATLDPVVKAGESFRFEPFMKEGVKEPLKSGELKAARETEERHLPEIDNDPDDGRVCSHTACMDTD